MHVCRDRVSLREGSYLLALRASTPGAYLPAIAGVPCRQGLDRYGESRVGLAECMVMARPLADEGRRRRRFYTFSLLLVTQAI